LHYISYFVREVMHYVSFTLFLTQPGLGLLVCFLITKKGYIFGKFKGPFTPKVQKGNVKYKSVQ